MENYIIEDIKKIIEEFGDYGTPNGVYLITQKLKNSKEYKDWKDELDLDSLDMNKFNKLTS
jgi:hypothetical protein